MSWIDSISENDIARIIESAGGFNSGLIKQLDEEAIEICRLADVGIAADDPPCNYEFDQLDQSDLSILGMQLSIINSNTTASNYNINNDNILNTNESILISKLGPVFNTIEKVVGNLSEIEIPWTEDSIFDSESIKKKLLKHKYESISNNELIGSFSGVSSSSLYNDNHYQHQHQLHHHNSNNNSTIIHNNNIHNYNYNQHQSSTSSSSTSISSSSINTSNNNETNSNYPKSRFQLPTNLLQKSKDILKLLTDCGWKKIITDINEIKSDCSVLNLFKNVGYYRPDFIWLKKSIGELVNHNNSNINEVVPMIPSNCLSVDIQIPFPWKYEFYNEKVLSSNNNENLKLIQKALQQRLHDVKTFDTALNYLLDGIDTPSIKDINSFSVRPQGLGPLSSGCGAILVTSPGCDKRASHLLSVLQKLPFSRAPILIVCKRKEMSVFKHIFEKSNSFNTIVYDGNNTDRAKHRAKMMNGFGLYLANRIDQTQKRAVLITCYELLFTDVVFFKSYLCDKCILDNSWGFISNPKFNDIAEELKKIHFRQLILSTCVNGIDGTIKEIIDNNSMITTDDEKDNKHINLKDNNGYISLPHPLFALQLLFPGINDLKNSIDIIELVSTLTIIDYPILDKPLNDNVVHALPWLLWNGLYPSLNYDDLNTLYNMGNNNNDNISNNNLINSIINDINGICFHIDLSDTILNNEIDKVNMNFQKHDEDSEVPAKASKKRNRGRENEAVAALVKSSAKTKKIEIKNGNGFPLVNEFHMSKCIIQKSDRWQVIIDQNGRMRYLGSYDTKEKAEIIYEHAMNQSKQWNEVAKRMNINNIHDLSNIDAKMISDYNILRCITLMMAPMREINETVWDAPDDIPSSYGALYSKKGEWAYIPTRKLILGKTYDSTINLAKGLNVHQTFGIPFFEILDKDKGNRNKKILSLHIESDPLIQRKHALIEWDKDIKKFKISSLHKNAPLMVDKELITNNSKSKVLNHKSIISIGSESFYFLLPKELPDNSVLMSPLEQRYKIIKTIQSSIKEDQDSNLTAANKKNEYDALSGPARFYKSSKSKNARSNRDWFDPVFAAKFVKVHPNLNDTQLKSGILDTESISGNPNDNIAPIKKRSKNTPSPTKGDGTSSLGSQSLVDKSTSNAFEGNNSSIQQLGLNDNTELLYQKNYLDANNNLYDNNTKNVQAITTQQMKKANKKKKNKPKTKSIFSYDAGNAISDNRKEDVQKIFSTWEAKRFTGWIGSQDVDEPSFVSLPLSWSFDNINPANLKNIDGPKSYEEYFRSSGGYAKMLYGVGGSGGESWKDYCYKSSI